MIWFTLSSKLVLLVTLSLLFSVLKRIKAGASFQKKTIRQFYSVGFLILFIPIANFLAQLILSQLNINIVAYADIFMIDSLINRSALFLITSILVFSFAYVLNSGMKIYEEQKLTV